jgi:hypothetical protein
MKTDMKTVREAGMRRLGSTGTLIAVALATHATAAVGQVRAAKAKLDTLRTDTTIQIRKIPGAPPRFFNATLDSLVVLLNKLQIGSAEYARTKEAIDQIIMSLPMIKPAFHSGNNTFSIYLAPGVT